MVMTRPQPCACIAGNNREVSEATVITMVSNCAASTAVSASTIRPGGGPPVLLTRMSTPPRNSSAAAISVSTTLSEVRSATTKSALPAPAALISAAARASLSPERPVRSTCAPSAANACAQPSPKPLDDDITKARFPASPRSISSILPVSFPDAPSTASAPRGLVRSTRVPVP